MLGYARSSTYGLGQADVRVSSDDGASRALIVADGEWSLPISIEQYVEIKSCHHHYQTPAASLQSALVEVAIANASQSSDFRISSIVAVQCLPQ